MSSSSSERKKNAIKKIKEENFKNIKSIATECQSLFNLIKQQEDIIKNFQEQERIIKKSIITHQRLKEDLETNRKNLIEVYKVAKEEEKRTTPARLLVEEMMQEYNKVSGGYKQIKKKKIYPIIKKKNRR